MKNLYLVFGLLFFSTIVLVNSGCKKDKDKDIMKFGQAKVAVTFGASSKSMTTVMTKQTPLKYMIALRSATLKGGDGTADYSLFNVSDLSQCSVYDFTDGGIRQDLTGGSGIPDGNYTSIELGIYYLQMKIQINSVNRGVEWRNMRIYFTEDATHKRGDVTQISEQGVELGWLFGENQMPDFDPVTPRINAYTQGGGGVNWYMFSDKNGSNYGPFGNMSFWNGHTAPYSEIAAFTFLTSAGQMLVVDFNVNNCWQFEDKSGDGFWGGDDLDPINPTSWNMALPQITIKLE
jgi:hypothetical protein